MKTYVAQLTIQAGEFEKSCIKLVNANSKEDAERKSLLGECHGAIGESSEWTESGIADMGWEFHYSVRSCREVAPEHVSIVRDYLDRVA